MLWASRLNCLACGCIGTRSVTMREFVCAKSRVPWLTRSVPKESYALGKSTEPRGLLAYRDAKRDHA